MSALPIPLPEILAHIHYLSAIIGGRGSCTPAEYQASEYVLNQMQQMGIRETNLESFNGVASTYKPYALAFIAALLGTIIVWLVKERWAYAIGAFFCGVGALGMYFESDFTSNWMRWLLPKSESQNAVGVIHSRYQPSQQVVLCAHVDSHRTPIFYSSPIWQQAFGALVGGAFISMVVSSLAYTVGFLIWWDGIRWIALAVAPMKIFALVMCLHADFTPFSPAANDNASGVGVTLGLAKQLVKQPLDRTTIWFAFTGCEEVGDLGMGAFLDRHAAKLGEGAIYIILDEVGLGQFEYLKRMGLLIKHTTHPYALELARQTAQGLPEIQVKEVGGAAYTDALLATKRGFIALSLTCNPAEDSGDVKHWHQMSDTMDFIQNQALENTYRFTWELLHKIDRASDERHG